MKWLKEMETWHKKKQRTNSMRKRDGKEVRKGEIINKIEAKVAAQHEGEEEEE